MNDFKLDDKKIKPGFKMPDNYFEAFPQRVTSKLEEKSVISLFSKRMNFIYAAAAVLVVALMVSVFNPRTTTELDDLTLESYLAYHSGITQFDMLTLLEQDDISAMEVDFPVEDEVIEEALSANSNFEHLLIEL